MSQNQPNWVRLKFDSISSNAGRSKAGNFIFPPNPAFFPVFCDMKPGFCDMKTLWAGQGGVGSLVAVYERCAVQPGSCSAHALFSEHPPAVFVRIVTSQLGFSLVFTVQNLEICDMKA